MSTRRNSACSKLSQSQLFQMQKSSYLFTEATSLILLILSWCIAWYLSYYLYGILVTMLIFLCLFHIIWFILLLIFVPKLTKPPHAQWFEPTHQIPVFKEKSTTTNDGILLRYYVSEELHPTQRKQIICLAPPLGQCGHLMYDPLIAQLGTEDYVYITWDYRGFFGSKNKYKYADSNKHNRKTSTLSLPASQSSSHPKIRDISIHEFALDINQILEAERIQCVDYMVGFSMGVAVALEFTVCFPHKLRSMILLNGSHGTVFSTAFQPVLRVPFIGDLVAEFVSFLLRNPHLIEHLRHYLLQPSMKYYLRIYVTIFGSPLLQDLMGEHYLYHFFEQYFNGICDDSVSLYHWLRAFQEMHSHSVYHLLDKITTPTLIVSGLFDLLLPCLTSFEMARKLPNAKHCCDVYSSHATIMENPESCVYEMVMFIKRIQKNKQS